MKNNALIILSAAFVFLAGTLYFRTPFFDSSINTNEATFEAKDGTTVVSSEYYRDLGGNWILLDKGVVIKDDELTMMSIPAK